MSFQLIPLLKLVVALSSLSTASAYSYPTLVSYDNNSDTLGTIGIYASTAVAGIAAVLGFVVAVRGLKIMRLTLFVATYVVLSTILLLASRSLITMLLPVIAAISVAWRRMSYRVGIFFLGMTIGIFGVSSASIFATAYFASTSSDRDGTILSSITIVTYVLMAVMSIASGVYMLAMDLTFLRRVICLLGGYTVSSASLSLVLLHTEDINPFVYAGLYVGGGLALFVFGLNLQNDDDYTCPYEVDDAMNQDDVLPVVLGYRNIFSDRPLRSRSAA